MKAVDQPQGPRFWMRICATRRKDSVKQRKGNEIDPGIIGEPRPESAITGSCTETARTAVIPRPHTPPQGGNNRPAKPRREGCFLEKNEDRQREVQQAPDEWRSVLRRRISDDLRPLVSHTTAPDSVAWANHPVIPGLWYHTPVTRDQDRQRRQEGWKQQALAQVQGNGESGFVGRTPPRNTIEGHIPHRVN